MTEAIENQNTQDQAIETNEEQNQAAGNWTDQLPEELRSVGDFDKFKVGDDEEFIKVPPSLAKSYAELSRKIGSKRLVHPDENATPEELNEFYKAVGRPDTSDDYGIGRPEDLPEELEYDEGLESEFKDKAHTLGLSKKQAVEIWDWYHDFQKDFFEETTQAATQQKSDAMLTLKKEWGRKYEENLARANNTLEEFGGDELASVIATGGMANNPAVIMTFAKIGERLGERSMVDNNNFAGSGKLTREGLEKMMVDPRYSNPSMRDAGYVRIVEDGFKNLFSNN